MPVEYFRWRVDGRHPPLLVAARSSWTRTVARRTAHAVRGSLRSRPSYIYICMYVSYATSMYILHRHTIKQAMSLSRDPHGYSYGDPYIYIRIYET